MGTVTTERQNSVNGANLTPDEKYHLITRNLQVTSFP